MDDINGNPVREGDEVLLYAQRYVATLLEDGEVPIYEEDRERPRPVADVPLVRGVVTWSNDMLAWGVRVSWTTCEHPPCWIHLGGGAYAVEVVTPNARPVPRTNWGIGSVKRYFLRLWHSIWIAYWRERLNDPVSFTDTSGLSPAQRKHAAHMQAWRNTFPSNI